ncbi:MAG TPA: DUF2071 domain-containing protein [Polyangia bacterium]|nr:DUF2071 domain-containing protein [Polyangia bacterium]
METTFDEPLATPTGDRPARSVTPAPAAGAASLPLEPAGRQWLPVSAHVRERYLVTFRAPAAAVARLCPAPLVVDSFRGYGFVSVCALELEKMGIAGTPSWLRFSNLEFLYRVGVRIDGAPSFLTLRSDVSARALALLGRPFSHYRPHLAQIRCARPDGRFRLVCRSRDGAADAEFEAAPDGAAPLDTSFADAAQAAAFMLGMRFSVDVRPGGRVRTQPIDHDPWGARFATPTRRHFAYVDALARAIGAPLVYDHTLAMRDLRQLWRAARWI